MKLLCESLQQKGHEVTVICCDGEKNEVINGVQIKRVFEAEEKLTLKQKGQLSSLIRKEAEKGDILHLYNMFFYDVMGMAIPRIKKPVVATLNNYPILRNVENAKGVRKIKRSLYNKAYLSNLKKIPHFICISETIEEHYLNRGFVKDQLTVIPNMLEPRFLTKPKARKAAKPIIRYIGTLYAKKGVDVLIRAMVIIAKKYPSARLIITGEGEEKDHLIKLAKDLKLQENILFEETVGYKDIIKRYEDSDILIHPGLWKEPFGRTIFEAMARARPIIVTDKGEPPKIVDRKDLVVKAGDEKALATKIQELLKSKIKRDAIGKDLRKKAEKYAVENVLGKVLRVYGNIRHKCWK